MDKDARIGVTGGETMIGAAILHELERQGYASVSKVDVASADGMFARLKPEYVFDAAGKSGGIQANVAYPADLMMDNLNAAIQVIGAAHRHGVRKLIYLASSCGYPRVCPQPMKEEYLFTGDPEPTSAAYATAKLAGIRLCQAYRLQYGANFIAAIPANAFGPGDDFSGEDSHVIAALIRRMDEAEANGESSVDVWGSGTPRREFIYVDDLADACIHAMQTYEGEAPINLGAGESMSIAELAEAVKTATGFQGEIVFDRSKPDGMPEKVLDTSKLGALGWRPRTPFLEALQTTCDWYRRRNAPTAPS